MTRHDELDIDLQPWMARNAPPAPDDLLLRVMQEVDTVSQRTRTWPSWLATTPATAWVTATAAVAILAVAAGLFFANSRPPVGGPPATPAATATPTPSPIPNLAPPVSVDAAIAGNIKAWSDGKSGEVYSLFMNGGSARIALDDSSWTEAYVSRELIAKALLQRGSNANTHRTGQILRMDSLAAHTVTWVENNETGQGIAVYNFDADNRIHSFWVLGMRVDVPAKGAMAPKSVVTLVDRCLAAVSAGNKQAFASCFDPNGELLIDVASTDGDIDEFYQGAAELGGYAADARSIDFRATRTSDIVMQGDFVAFTSPVSTAGADVSTIVVDRLTPDHTKILYQWVFGG